MSQPHPHSLGPAALRAAAQAFRERMRQVRAQHPIPGGWYPYDSFASFDVVEGMLRGEHERLFDLAGAAPVLDLGCGDGDLSFFAESLGLRAIAVDHAGPNFNRTEGFRTLRAALGSAVEFRDCDLDAPLGLGARTFGLALCLGVLYHLKNPYGFLERLSHQARHCLLSTRVARVTASGASIEREPVAYLVDPFETNADSTNFWIFSEAGLRRACERAGWDIAALTTSGCKRGSDPCSPDRDERAFCLLASKRPDPWASAELEDGWHEMEEGGWRWTGRAFSARMARGGAFLRLRFQLPEASVRALGRVRLRAFMDGVELPPVEYSSPGAHVYEQPAPAGTGSALVRFELDCAMQTEGDARELGLQVVFWSGAGAEARQHHPIEIAD